MQLQTAKQYADTHHLSHSFVRAQCDEGKIPGAIKPGRDWLIPIGMKPGEEIELESTTTFAKKVGYSQMQVRRWIKDGQIKAHFIGRDYLIDPEQEIDKELDDRLRKMRKKKMKRQSKG